MESIVKVVDGLLANPRASLSSPLSDLRGVNEETAAEYADGFDPFFDPDPSGGGSVETISDLLMEPAALDTPFVSYSWITAARHDLLGVPCEPADIGVNSVTDFVVLRFATTHGPVPSEKGVYGAADVQDVEFVTSFNEALWRTDSLSFTLDSQQALNTVAGPVEISGSSPSVLVSTGDEVSLLDDAETTVRINADGIKTASLLFRTNFAAADSEATIALCEADSDIAYSMGYVEKGDLVVGFSVPDVPVVYFSRVYQRDRPLLERLVTEQLDAQ